MKQIIGLKKHECNDIHDWDNWNDEDPNNDYVDNFDVWISVKFKYPIDEAVNENFTPSTHLNGEVWDEVWDGIWEICNSNKECTHLYKYEIDVKNKTIYFGEDMGTNDNSRCNCIIEDIQQTFARNLFKVKYH